MASHGFLEDSLFTFDISHQKRPFVKQYISKQPHTRRVQILNVARYAYSSCRFPVSSLQPGEWPELLLFKGTVARDFVPLVYFMNRPHMDA